MYVNNGVTATPHPWARAWADNDVQAIVEKAFVEHWQAHGLERIQCAKSVKELVDKAVVKTITVALAAHSEIAHKEKP
jgi:hypothetical protein